MSGLDHFEDASRVTLSGTSVKRKSSAATIIFASLFFATAYAAFRYHIVGPVPWKDFPFFILNKSVSLAAFTILAINFSLRPLKNLGVNPPRSWMAARKTLGTVAFLLVIIHGVMSFMLFSAAYYGKFFGQDGTLTLFAGLSMLGGVLSLMVLWVCNSTFQTHLRDNKALIAFITERKFVLSAMLLMAAHLFFMGYEGWLKPEDWNGGLPPISLVSFVIFSTGYVINILGRK